MCAKLLLVCPCDDITIGVVAVDCNGVTMWTDRFDWCGSPPGKNDQSKDG